MSGTARISTTTPRTCASCGTPLTAQGICPKCMLELGGEPSTTAAVPAPARIPHYKLFRCIGSGGFGQVWLAWNETLEAFCAIKVIRRDLSEELNLFDRELRGLRRSAEVSRSHPGLVDILTAGKDDAEGFFFYAMELADDLEKGRELVVDRYVARTLGRVLE